MKFQEGNKIWQKRTKHGRSAIFTDPIVFQEEIKKYFEYTDSRKWTKKDWVGKDANEVTRETETPYTLAGLCIFLGVSRHWWNEFRSRANSEFLEVIRWTEDIMYMQKFEGAAVGAFNSNIIARDLGLVEKIDTKTDGSITFTFEEAPIKKENDN